MSALIQTGKHSVHVLRLGNPGCFYSYSTILATILTPFFFIISWFLFCHGVWIDFTDFILFNIILTCFRLILNNVGWNLCSFNNLGFILMDSLVFSSLLFDKYNTSNKCTSVYYSIQDKYPREFHILCISQCPRNNHNNSSNRFCKLLCIHFLPHYGRHARLFRNRSF